MKRSPSQNKKKCSSYHLCMKTFSGEPSRTEVNLISASLSLYDNSPFNIVRRSLVVHVRPDDLSSTNKWDSFEESDILACGLIEGTDFEKAETLLDLEKQTKVSEKTGNSLVGTKASANWSTPLVNNFSFPTISSTSRGKMSSNCTQR